MTTKVDPFLPELQRAIQPDAFEKELAEGLMIVSCRFWSANENVLHKILHELKLITSDLATK